MPNKDLETGVGGVPGPGPGMEAAESAGGHTEYGDDAAEGAGEEFGGEFVDPGPHLAQNSAIPMSVIPKNKGGRPRKDGLPPGSTAEMQRGLLANPKFQTYKTDADNPNQRSKSLWRWWNALTPAQRDVIQCYVYRDWPALVVPPDRPDVGEPGTNPNIDKISGAEPIQDDIDFLHRYGAGGYYIRLNRIDEGHKGTITMCHITGLSKDLKSHPPSDKRISDITQVDLTHPENQSYVAFLRMTGRLPNEQSEKQKEEDMANVETVTKLTNTVERLADKAIEAGNKKSAEGGSLNEKTLEMYAKGMEATVGMVRDEAQAIRQRAEEDRRAWQEQMKPQTTSPVADPLEQALRITELISRNRGSDDLLVKVMEMQEKGFQRMEALIEKLVTRPTAVPTPITERIKDLKELREISDTLFGGNDKEDVPGIGDAVAELGPKWLRPFVPYAPLIGGMLQGFLKMGLPGAPTAPPAAFPGATGGITGPYAGLPPQAQGFAGIPPQSPGPIPVPSPAAAPQPGAVSQLPPEVENLLSSIRLPFISHIRAGIPGDDFARWFADGYGDDIYEQVKTFGPEQLLGAISIYPPITSTLIEMRVPEQTVIKFVEAFCKADIGMEDDDGKGAIIIGPGPNPTSAPGVPSPGIDKEPYPPPAS